MLLRARVKEKLDLSDTSRDAAIDALILEMVPVIEYAIRPECLADPGPGVQSTLALGAYEIVCGEALAQFSRSPGASEAIRLGDLELAPAPGDGGLIAKGWRRLRPFLRDDVGSAGGRVQTSGTGGWGTE